MAKVTSGNPSDPIGMRVEFGALPIHFIDDKISPRLMRDAQIAAIDYVESLVQRVFTENTPIGVGFAYMNVQYERPNRFDSQPSGFVGYAAPASTYMLFVETGTQPHVPPIGPLIYWAGRKFGDTKIAFVVRRAIMKRGTKPQWFVKRTQEMLIPPVSMMMLDRIESYLNSPTARLRNFLGL